MSRRLAVDVGQVRVGLAISEGSLALPLETMSNDPSCLSKIAKLAEEKAVEVIYVGLPLNLRGEHTQSTKSAIDFGRNLSSSGFQVRFIDERMTTKSAQQMIRSTGKNTKESRSFIDAQAAALILDFALNAERGGLAGVSIDELDN